MCEMISLPTRVTPSTWILEFEFGGGKREPWVILDLFPFEQTTYTGKPLLSIGEALGSPAHPFSHMWEQVMNQNPGSLLHQFLPVPVALKAGFLLGEISSPQTLSVLFSYWENQLGAPCVVPCVRNINWRGYVICSVSRKFMEIFCKCYRKNCEIPVAFKTRQY